jgi:hypothetical protein
MGAAMNGVDLKSAAASAAVVPLSVPVHDIPRMYDAAHVDAAFQNLALSAGSHVDVRDAYGKWIEAEIVVVDRSGVRPLRAVGMNVLRRLLP